MLFDPPSHERLTERRWDEPRVRAAIAAIADTFEFYAVSPHYYTDWRWYKSLTPGATDYNERGTEQYWTNAHNLLDYRRLFAARAPDDNQQLYGQCRATRDLIRQYEATRDAGLVTTIRAGLEDVQRSVRAFSPDIADAVKSVGALLSRMPPDAAAVARDRQFGPWFGRGQQYVSFSRS